MNLLDMPKGLDDRTSAYFFSITHPTVDKVGVLFPVEYGQNEDGSLAITVQYDSPVVECAFFANGEWWLNSVDGFLVEDPAGYVFTEQYPEETTRVYPEQPRDGVEAFLAAHGGEFLRELIR